jgi:hypothetical protein
MTTFRDPAHVPPQFWSIARRVAAGQHVTLSLTSMKQAQQLRARWYHCRRICGSHVPANIVEAELFMALRTTTASVRGTQIVFSRAPDSGATIEDVLEHEFGAGEALPAHASGAVSDPPPTAGSGTASHQETIFERLWQGKK